MRPLFWTRILLDDDEKQDKASIWSKLKPHTLDVDEFERLFSQKIIKRKVAAVEAGATDAKKKVIRAFCALDAKRAQGIGILMGSTKVTMETLAKAVLKLDGTDIPFERINGLYEQRATSEELELIKMHLETQQAIEEPEDRAPLDDQSDFVHRLSQIHRFAQRVECWGFKEGFDEKMTDCGAKLAKITAAVAAIQESDGIIEVLRIVLAFGNYMNGGTGRGQADGFNLEIMGKLRDVKTQDNSSTLLHHVAEKIWQDTEAKPGEEPVNQIPGHETFKAAAELSFEEIDAEALMITRDLEQVRRKIEQVVRGIDDEALVQPFKDSMEEFVAGAKAAIDKLAGNTKETRAKFEELVRFFAFKLKKKGAAPTPGDMFEIWAKFASDYMEAWTKIQRRHAKQRLEAARLAKQQIRDAKTSRKAGGSRLASRLKQKFGHKKKKAVSDETRLERRVAVRDGIVGRLGAAATDATKEEAALLKEQLADLDAEIETLRTQAAAPATSSKLADGSKAAPPVTPNKPSSAAMAAAAAAAGKSPAPVLPKSPSVAEGTRSPPPVLPKSLAAASPNRAAPPVVPKKPGTVATSASASASAKPAKPKAGSSFKALHPVAKHAHPPAKAPPPIVPKHSKAPPPVAAKYDSQGDNALPPMTSRPPKPTQLT